jgi:hypothetical protein
MRKLIHSKFELDLSPFKISDTEENNWFSDSFFTKYTFPFDIDLTDDLDIALDFISLYNTNPETYFEVMYVHNNKIEKAIFEIDSHQEKLSCIVRFGFEQLPSFDKKLSELSLEKFNLPEGVNIYDFAETIITKKWPEVNYNFPQVHTDKYDTSEKAWFYFERIINNRKAGKFLINQIDIPNQETYNRNIIQPLPYWLHILQRGMIDAGYTLSGEILNDEILKKATVYGSLEYFLKNKLNEYYFRINTTSFVTYSTYNTNKYRATYYKSEIITGIGAYKVTGAVISHSLPNESAYVRIKLNGNIILEINRPVNETDTNQNIMFNPNFSFTTTNNTNTLEFEALGNYEIFNPNFAVFNVYVRPLLFYKNDDVFVEIINENKVDLTKSVADITFGDFVKIVKNWFNYDLTIIDKLAVMNPIENKINYQDMEDFQFSEIKKPFRKFKKGISFLLKFQDIENKLFPYLPVFQNKMGITNSGYITDEKTTTIVINALPLPLLTRNGSKTAFDLENNESKIYIVSYDGIYNENNYAKPIDDYLLPAVHLKSWKKWFDFRINSPEFNWVFTAWNEQLISLKAKTKIFAYKRVHIIKTINKSEIRPDLYEVEIETEGLE